MIYAQVWFVAYSIVSRTIYQTQFIHQILFISPSLYYIFPFHSFLISLFPHFTFSPLHFLISFSPFHFFPNSFFSHSDWFSPFLHRLNIVALGAQLRLLIIQLFIQDRNLCINIQTRTGLRNSSDGTKRRKKWSKNWTGKVGEKWGK